MSRCRYSSPDSQTYEGGSQKACLRVPVSSVRQSAGVRSSRRKAGARTRVALLVFVARLPAYEGGSQEACLRVPVSSVRRRPASGLPGTKRESGDCRAARLDRQTPSSRGWVSGNVFAATPAQCWHGLLLVNVSQPGTKWDSGVGSPSDVSSPDSQSTNRGKSAHMFAR